MLLCTQGCDGSIMLANSNSEKDHPDDISLAGDGFDTVIKAKAAVDKDPKCRNKVSCADILALATRDVVNLVCLHFLREIIDNSITLPLNRLIQHQPCMQIKNVQCVILHFVIVTSA